MSRTYEVYGAEAGLFGDFWMILLISMLSILGGTCLACNAGRTPYEKHAEMVSGLLLVAGLGMIGAMLPILR